MEHNFGGVRFQVRVEEWETKGREALVNRLGEVDFEDSLFNLMQKLRKIRERGVDREEKV